MIYKTRITGLIIGLVFLLMAFSMPIQAEEETNIDIIVITEENINASFNATAGGDISIWIDGVELQSEFVTITDVVNSISTDVDDVRNDLNYAFMVANGNTYKILELNESLQEAFIEILENYNRTENNNNSIRDLIFWAYNLENNYLIFKDETHDNFTSVKLKNEEQDNELDSLKGQISNLQSQLNHLNSTFGTIGIILVIIGVLACSLYLYNRRYPLAEIGGNGKNISKAKKHRHIVDFINKPQKSKKAKTKSLSFKIKHIRRNPKKSIVKQFFS